MGNWFLFLDFCGYRENRVDQVKGERVAFSTSFFMALFDLRANFASVLKVHEVIDLSNNVY